MQSKSNTAIRLNSDSLETKIYISNSKEKLINTSNKCLPSFSNKFDHHLVDKLGHHRNIGAVDVYFKPKRRKLNNGD